MLSKTINQIYFIGLLVIVEWTISERVVRGVAFKCGYVVLAECQRDAC